MSAELAPVAVMAGVALLLSMGALVWVAHLYLRLLKVFDLFENEPRIQRYRE